MNRMLRKAPLTALLQSAPFQGYYIPYHPVFTGLVWGQESHLPHGDIEGKWAALPSSGKEEHNAGFTLNIWISVKDY